LGQEKEAQLPEPFEIEKQYGELFETIGISPDNPAANNCGALPTAAARLDAPLNTISLE